MDELSFTKIFRHINSNALTAIYGFISRVLFWIFNDGFKTVDMIMNPSRLKTK